MKKFLEKLIPPESRPERVGPRIQAMRMALGLTAAQFADSLDYDRGTLSKVEQGKNGLDIKVGVNIAGLYGVGLDYIYRGDLSDLPPALRDAVVAALTELLNQP